MPALSGCPLAGRACSVSGPTFKIATKVDALCWCQRSIVLVPAERIRAGFTLACNRRECQEMADTRQKDNS